MTKVTIPEAKKKVLLFDFKNRQVIKLTSSLQAAIIIKAVRIVGLRISGFSLNMSFRLNFNLQVVPYVMSFFNL